MFGSWDRFTLPYPFARVVVHFGEPMHVPRDVEPADRPALARELEARLAAAEKTAQAELAGW